ncbi:MAG: radical SAM protein [Chloroflexi bacterium]|nr:radical SAM protein [Chloroflexota bacterium]
MKVLVLNPPFKGKYSRTSRSPAVTRGGTLYYPFWLAYCTGVLEQAGHQVQLLDAPAEDLSTEAVVDRAAAFNPDLIVADTTTPSIYNDVAVVARVKLALPKAFVVLVGTHASALPEETLALSPGIDAVARGEYDYTIRDLARCLESGGNLACVSGLVFRDGEDIRYNEARPRIEDLDSLPFVSEVYRRHLNIRNYFFAAADYPMVMLITGRGCPFRCFFCVYPQTIHGRRYRLRSAENVVDEFEYIARELPEVREIGIEDDTFTANRQRTRDICELILSRGLPIKWYCNVRVDLDLETMRLMKRAGCRLLTVGFESADQEALNLMHKGITVEQIRRFVEDARKANLLVHGCFMAGNPGETRESLEKSLSLAKELNCDSMQFYPLIVYPGTEAYQWAEEKGFLAVQRYDAWLQEDGHYSCLLNSPELTREDIACFCDRATREYYLRPRYIMMKARRIIGHPGEIRRTVKSAGTFFRSLF